MAQSLLHWLPQAFGLDVEPDTALHLELAAWPTGGSALLVLGGALAALMGIVVVYGRDARAATWRQRTALTGLRCAALLAVMLILLEPTVVAVQRTERQGHSILLVDTSQSMAQRDRFGSDAVADLVKGWQTFGVADPATATRLELAKSVLATQQHRLTRTLAARNRLHCYGFGQRLEPLPMLAVPPDLDHADGSAIPDLPALQASGPATNLGGAVREALERSRDAAIASVVLLTDGRRNLGPKGAEIARLCAQRQIAQLIVLGIGDPSDLQSLRLTRVEAPDKVLAKDPFRVSARLQSLGYGAVTIAVRLGRSGLDGTAPEVVATQTVTVGGATPDVEVTFEQVQLAATGEHLLTVEIEPPAGEAIRGERHRAQTRVEVLDGKTRVLLIAGGPSHEYRALRSALLRDATIEVQCWLQSADPDFPQDGDLPIEALPIDQESIDPIDVVVLVDPNPHGLTAGFCALLAQHVERGGAGIWWICGEKFALDAFRATATSKPLADLLGIVPDLERADRRIIGFGHAFEKDWPLALTPEGRTHSATGIGTTPADSALLWPQVPGCRFLFPVDRVKPLAQVLVTSVNPLGQVADRPAPILVAQLVGAGRSLFTASDETYRWRGAFLNAYDRLWVRGLRWLFEGRMQAGRGRVQIQPSAERVELGNVVEILVRATHPAAANTAADRLQLQVTRPDGSQESMTLERSETTGSEYQGTYQPRSSGFHTLTLSEPDSGEGVAAQATIQVVAAVLEQEGPVDQAELAAIAAGPDAVLLRSPEQIWAAIDRVPSLRAADVARTPRALWDTWLTVVVLVSVLTAEWLLRKRCNLL